VFAALSIVAVAGVARAAGSHTAERRAEMRRRAAFAAAGAAARAACARLDRAAALLMTFSQSIFESIFALWAKDGYGPAAQRRPDGRAAIMLILMRGGWCAGWRRGWEHRRDAGHAACRRHCWLRRRTAWRRAGGLRVLWPGVGAPAQRFGACLARPERKIAARRWRVPVRRFARVLAPFTRHGVRAARQ
jgi:hypothetical protein